MPRELPPGSGICTGPEGQLRHGKETIKNRSLRRVERIARRRFPNRVPMMETYQTIVISLVLAFTLVAAVSDRLTRKVPNS